MEFVYLNDIRGLKELKCNETILIHYIQILKLVVSVFILGLPEVFINWNQIINEAYF